MPQSKEIEFGDNLPDVPQPPKERKEGFSQVPHKLIDSNVLCMLQPQAVLLYLVLLRYSRHNKGYVYTDQIVKNTNIHRTHISRHIKQLVLFHLITITKQSRRHGYKRYKINNTALHNNNIIT